MRRFLSVSVVVLCVLCVAGYAAHAEGLVFEEGIYKVTFPGGKVTTQVHRKCSSFGGWME